MTWIQKLAEEKLMVYRQEAVLRRQLPAAAWRAQVAQVLRGVAERLEPTFSPTLGERLGS